MKKLMINSMIVVVMATSCQASGGIHWSDLEPAIVWLQESVRKGEMTERGLRLEAEALARKHRILAEASPDAKPHFSTPDTKRCLSALNLLRRIGDKQSLPLFAEMAGSSDWIIRFNGIANYVKIAGVVGSLPFVENVPADPDSPDANRHRAYQALEQEILRYPLSAEEIKKICAFMLGRKNPESDEMVRWLDGKLNEHVPDYIDSVHRKKVAERLAKSNREAVRNYWAAVKGEIKNAPELKRERENERKRKQAHDIEIIKNKTDRGARLIAMVKFLYPMFDDEYLWRVLERNDQATFAEWIKDKNENVRMIAALNLTDEELLAKAAKNDKSEWVRKEAAEQLDKVKKQKEAEK